MVTSSFALRSLSLIVLIYGQLALAVSPCTAETRTGKTCLLASVLTLHPTQFAVGMREVGEKKTKLEAMGAAELDRYLEKHPIPVIIGLGGKFFLIDHHHLGRALADADTRTTRADKSVYVKVERNWNDREPGSFWEEMSDNHYFYLKDERGRTRTIVELERVNTVRDLRDDPFRSLAGAVRTAGGFDKSTIPFAEFTWAEYFRAEFLRRRLVIVPGETGWKAALAAAMRMAREPAARSLPGSRA